MLYINGLPNVLKLLFENDVFKMVTPRSQRSSLQWPMKLDFPINPGKCNYTAIGLAAPLHLSFGTVTRGDSMQIVNGVTDGRFHISFLLILLLPTTPASDFLPLFNTWVQPHLKTALQTYSLNLSAVRNGANRKFQNLSYFTKLR